VDFALPEDLQRYLAELDEFIEREIRPLEQQDDNGRFFDHRREDARTDWDRGGLPSREWEALLGEARRRADAAGHYRYAFPQEYGGRDGTNLGMAVIREHLASRGLGLHCDLQNEHAIVGNNVGLLLMLHYGSPEQKKEWVDDLAAGKRHFAFGITEPNHGSDATFMETSAVRDGDDWVINGEKTWNTGIHTASHDLVFARTSGAPGSGQGITGFLVPVSTPGFTVEEYLWTFNMPTDHAHVSFTDVRVPDSAILGAEGRGLQLVQHFFNENRIRQAASSLGAAQFCIDRSVAYAKERKPFGKPLASNQAIQFPLVELHTQAAMLRALIRETAWSMDTYGSLTQADKVSMCNYVANRLCCDAADRAMQVHGGLGYSRHQPFEHIYRHHRRYRITEGAEEIQLRRVAGYLFGFIKADTLKGVTDLGLLADGSHGRLSGLHQVGGRELDLEPPASGAAEHRAEVQRRGVDHHPEPLALADRGDAAGHVPGGPLGRRHLGHRGLLAAAGGGERLEVELAFHRDHPGHQGPVHFGDQRLEHAVRRDAERLAGLAAVGLGPRVVGVFVHGKRDLRPLERRRRRRPASRHGRHLTASRGGRENH
jgi:acyl-CoA dehydrogenase